MSTETIEQLTQVAKVLLQWGGYLVLYGLILMVIGGIALILLDVYVSMHRPTIPNPLDRIK